MNLQKAYNTVLPFFTMKEKDVLRQFAELSDQAIVTTGKHLDHSSVFIPGTRDDRILLVAHADTVFPNGRKDFAVDFGGEDFPMFFSPSRRKGYDKKGSLTLDGVGIGADDRAGCAALWALKDLGHSLLITNGEEIGCVGSRWLMSSEKMASVVQEHRFAVQFDRKGRNDLVFYNVGTQQFADYLVEETKYSIEQGSYTDICVLCEKICGVNVSIGFSGEHTANEMLNLRYWMRTVKTFEAFLSKENLPKFEL